MTRNEITKTKKSANSVKAKELCGCENREWLWCNGENFCPYCGKLIRV